MKIGRYLLWTLAGWTTALITSGIASAQAPQVGGDALAAEGVEGSQSRA